MSIMKIKNADGTWSPITAIQGEKGDKGDTPHIGENGNWWVGDTDTGVKAEDDTLDGLLYGGCKGYYYSAIDLINRTIYLSDSTIHKQPVIGEGEILESFDSPKYTIGSYIGLTNGSHYLFTAKIKDIQHNAILYEGDIGFTQIVTENDPDSHVFFVPEQPDIGLFDFVNYGDNCGGFSYGEDAKGIGRCSIAIGRDVVAYNYGSAFGRKTRAAAYSHAEGYQTTAKGAHSHAEGVGTIASSSNQHVQGKHNIEDNNDDYADIVGNGNSETARSNAYTLDWKGNGRFAGDVYVCGSTKNSGEKKLATEEYVNNKIVDSADLLNIPKIERGSYVGTGKAFSANPNTLTFNFIPHVVIVFGDYPSTAKDAKKCAILINGLTLCPVITSGDTISSQSSSFGQPLITTWDNENMSVSYYSNYEAAAQLNYSGYSYNYMYW